MKTTRIRALAALIVASSFAVARSQQPGVERSDRADASTAGGSQGTRPRENEAPRVYRAGEAWFENPGSRHPVSVNASNTEPARLLAVVIVDADETHVTIPDAE